MRKVRAIGSVLHSQLVDWFYSPRTFISVVILMALAYMNARSYSYMLENTQLYAYWEESIYYFISNGFGNITLTSALFLIMMAEIPRRIAFQNILLLRSSRRTWLSSQIVFCCLATVLMIVMLLIFSMLFSYSSISIGTGWSDLERIAADPDSEWMQQLTSAYIREITPGQASLASFLILFFFWFTMTLVILVCTLWDKPNVGMIAYVTLLVLHVALLWESLPSWMRYMPVNFSTLQYVGSTFPERELQVIPYVISAYLLADVLLILIMNVKVKRMELFFTERS